MVGWAAVDYATFALGRGGVLVLGVRGEWEKREGN